MRSYKLLNLLIAIVTVTVPFFAKDKIIESKWTAMPPQIDGQAIDWAQNVLDLSKSENVSYAFKNDADHLYLLFIFNESKTLSSIAATGMTFWINTEGKEKKTHGLRFYQKILNGQQLIQQMEKQGELIPEEKKAELLNSKTPFKLFGCDGVNKKGEVVPLATRGVATYRAGKDGKNTVYEFVIPMAFLKDPASETPFDTTKPFKFGFEWGGATPEILKALVSDLGDQGVRAGGERGGNLETQVRGEESGEYTAGSPDMSSMRRRLPKKYDFWIDLKVAQNQ
jgi:hypothetical protein